MATFYVGQRVRIINDGTLRPNHEGIGREGVIDGEQDDVLRWSVTDMAGVGWWCHGDCLAPIRPEGSRMVEWSACLWMPEHLREVA